VTDFYGCIDVQRNEKGGKYDRREESLPDLGCNKREGKADRGQRNFSHILVLVGESVAVSTLSSWCVAP
jgi:hypothetical protein